MLICFTIFLFFFQPEISAIFLTWFQILSIKYFLLLVYSNTFTFLFNQYKPVKIGWYKIWWLPLHWHSNVATAGDLFVLAGFNSTSNKGWEQMSNKSTFSPDARWTKQALLIIMHHNTELIIQSAACLPLASCCVSHHSMIHTLFTAYILSPETQYVLVCTYILCILLLGSESSIKSLTCFLTNARA